LSLIKEIDYGTPESPLKDTARESGVEIPRLCATDSLKPFGSCRLCVVEVEGRKGYPASCTTPVEPGMKIRTQTDQVARLRRNVMELYISDHPLDCLTCSANGDCELQDMAGAVGLREVRYGMDGANHLDAPVDDSNPYFSFDPSKCIVCSRCVRACDEVQGTFALTIEGRGFDSKVAASVGETFLESECVSCGACIQVCPTATLMEKSIIDHGQPEHSVITTCAYCGVGCSFKAEMKGDQVVRMTPYKDGEANHGHSCVKGRFAWGYSTHKDRVLDPMIRDNTSDPWRKVTWDEAIGFAARRFKEIQEKYGRKSIGGITSSRCTNEEVWLVQKLVRAAFGNNNVDTCARVCHSPTGYGLKQTLGTSAGTQLFDSVMDADVITVIGANPTEGHPVFASQMIQRLRQGAKLIVIDPRKIGLVRSPHIKADYHVALLPGTNVPIINAFAHVAITEGFVDEGYVAERCDTESFEAWKACMLKPEYSPEEVAKISGVPADIIYGAARLYGSADKSAIYYGLGVSEHSQGSTMVMGMANLAMATGNIGFTGVGVNPLRGQNNVQGSCDMGSFPHELPGYRPVQDDEVRSTFEKRWGVELDPEPGFRIPNMFDAAIAGKFKGMYIQGEDLAQSDPNTQHVEAALSSMECLVVQDLFLVESAKFAHVFLPGTSFLEKDGTFAPGDEAQAGQSRMADHSGASAGTRLSDEFQ
jgi:formate dehydrogenase major subunit